MGRGDARGQGRGVFGLCRRAAIRLGARRGPNQEAAGRPIVSGAVAGAREINEGAQRVMSASGYLVAGQSLQRNDGADPATLVRRAEDNSRAETGIVTVRGQCGSVEAVDEHWKGETAPHPRAPLPAHHPHPADVSRRPARAPAARVTAPPASHAGGRRPPAQGPGPRAKPNGRVTSLGGMAGVAGAFWLRNLDGGAGLSRGPTEPSPAPAPDPGPRTPDSRRGATRVPPTARARWKRWKAAGWSSSRPSATRLGMAWLSSWTCEVVELGRAGVRCRHAEHLHLPGRQKSCCPCGGMFDDVADGIPPKWTRRFRIS